MANHRTWMKQFRAYFNAGHLNTLPCTQQQAYSNNCLDDVLRARVNREALATMPIYSPVVGLITCISILDLTFLESNPIHLRRKQFFVARQWEGQTVIEFQEELNPDSMLYERRNVPRTHGFSPALHAFYRT